MRPLFIISAVLFASISIAQPIIEWQNSIGGDLDDILLSIQQTNDSGYVLGGYSTSNISGDKTESNLGGWDYWIVKADKAGVIQWENTIGGGSDDVMRSVGHTNDAGYVMGGRSDSNISGDKTENTQGGNDYWLVKAGSTGAIQWQNTIGGSADDVLQSIQQTTDSGYVMAGYSISNTSGDKTENAWLNTQDYWVIKADSLGVIQWQNTIG